MDSHSLPLSIALNPGTPLGNPLPKVAAKSTAPSNMREAFGPDNPHAKAASAKAAGLTPLSTAAIKAKKAAGDDVG